MQAETLFPSMTVEGQHSAPCRQSPTPRVSLDHELEVHIEDCHWQYRMAYERFQHHGLPSDRDEALLHLHRMNIALLARSPVVQAERHAAFEQQLDEGIDYFQFAGACARAGAEGHA